MITLRDYQDYIYKECQKAILNGYKGLLVESPCRSGKSYIFASMVENLKSGYALIIAHRKELLNQHIRLFEKLNIPKNKYRFASVFTECNHISINPPKLIVIDEAHLSETNSYKKVCNAYQDATVIGFTATPQRLSGERLSLFNILISGISVNELIQRGDISDFDYYAPNLAIDLDNVDIRYGDYNVKQLSQIMCKSKLYGDYVKAYQNIANGKQTIAYAVSRKNAKEIAYAFNTNGIPAVEIDSKDSLTDREKVLDAFKEGEFKVLVNVNLLSEGMTLPECECVMMLRPTMSLALYIQQAMRCLTPMENKKAVIIDCVGNFQRHGLPNEEREWKLTGKVKHKVSTENGTYSIRACENCFRTFEAKYKECPYCHTEYKVKGRELKRVEEVELKRIKSEEQEALKEAKKKMRMEVGRARTIDDLRRIAKERGYSNGWIFVQMKLKGIRK